MNNFLQKIQHSTPQKPKLNILPINTNIQLIFNSKIHINLYTYTHIDYIYIRIINF